MSYKAVMFDLDGTLFDSIPIIMRSFREVCESLGVGFDETGLLKTIGIPLSVQAQRFAGDQADEFVVRYRRVYRINQEKHARLFPYTGEMLDTLRTLGYKTALVTSKSDWATRHALQITGILEQFQVIVTADDVTHPKPHPEPILKAINSLGITTADALYVGDSMFDVDAARKAEVDVVAVSWGARSREELLLECPAGVFDTWQQFLDWLAKS